MISAPGLPEEGQLPGLSLRDSFPVSDDHTFSQVKEGK